MWFLRKISQKDRFHPLSDGNTPSELVLSDSTLKSKKSLFHFQSTTTPYIYTVHYKLAKIFFDNFFIIWDINIRDGSNYSLAHGVSNSYILVICTTTRSKVRTLRTRPFWPDLLTRDQPLKKSDNVGISLVRNFNEFLTKNTQKY